MPQGDFEKLNLNNPLNIKAYQYDIVCNGVELVFRCYKKSYTRINVQTFFNSWI